ncbi:MAG TPA: transporter, partial [Propionibacterium sp.]|nr:transporter [Propionibacterium sp.]
MSNHGERLSSIVDAGYYVDGARIASPTTFEQSFHLLDEHDTGFMWIGLYRPSHADMALLAEEF